MLFKQSTETTRRCNMSVRMNWDKEHVRDAMRKSFVAKKSKPWGKKLPKYQCNMCNRMETIDRLEHMTEMDELLLEGDKGHGTCPICRVSILFMVVCH